MSRCGYNCFTPGIQGPVPPPEFFFNVRDDDVEPDVITTDLSAAQILGPTFRINRGDTLNFRGDNISIEKTPDGVLIDLFGPTGPQPNFSGYGDNGNFNVPILASNGYVVFPFSGDDEASYIESPNFDGTLYHVTVKGVYYVSTDLAFMVQLNNGLRFCIKRNNVVLSGTVHTVFGTTGIFHASVLVKADVGDTIGVFAITNNPPPFITSVLADQYGFNVALIKRLRSP